MCRSAYYRGRRREWPTSTARWASLFGVELHPHNRHSGAKVLRARWQGHIDASLCRPVLIIDEGQEMQLSRVKRAAPVVLGALGLAPAA